MDEEEEAMPITRLCSKAEFSRLESQVGRYRHDVLGLGNKLLCCSPFRELYMRLSLFVYRTLTGQQVNRYTTRLNAGKTSVNIESDLRPACFRPRLVTLDGDRFSKTLCRLQQLDRSFWIVQVRYRL